MLRCKHGYQTEHEECRDCEEEAKHTCQFCYVRIGADGKCIPTSEGTACELCLDRNAAAKNCRIEWLEETMHEICQKAGSCGQPDKMLSEIWETAARAAGEKP